MTQSTANLTLTPNSLQTYSSIISNNLAVSSPIGYLLINSGDEEATNLAFNLAGTNPTLFQVIGGTCITGGTLSNLSGSNACTISTQFGPAPNGSAGNKSALFNVGYTPYSGATTISTADVIFTGTVTAAPSATFINSISANNFMGGTGTSASPYTGNTSTSYTLSINYVNTSTTTSASGFTTNNSTLPINGWTLTNHGCENVTMSANGGNCTDTYTLNSTVAGSHELNLNNSTASWVDSSGTYLDQVITGVGIIYTELSTPIPPASLSGVMSSDTFTTGSGTSGSKFSVTEGTTPAPTITYTISNNSTGAANNFYVDWVQPNGWTMTTNNCGTSGNPVTIAGTAGSCNIIFELDTSAAAEYDLDLSSLTMYWTNSGSATQQSQVLSGTIYAQVVATPATKMIFVSTSGSAGGFGAFTNADTICQSDATSGSKTNIAGATWKALLQGNNATTIGTTYVTTMNETIATATTTNLIASGTTNNTLTHAINRDRDGTQVSQLIWTGGSAANTTSSTTKNCSAWSSSLSTRTGGYGSSSDTTIWWNYVSFGTTYNQPCDQLQSLYCVQQ
ncbi:MAG: hypothetical protein EKK54_03285 [Neisseriaceae bacterium]|nr:MAG: hypothetical protein EKK54_03285 [Neisseriaceae bacterium]